MPRNIYTISAGKRHPTDVRFNEVIQDIVRQGENYGPWLKKFVVEHYGKEEEVQLRDFREMKAEIIAELRKELCIHQQIKPDEPKSGNRIEAAIAKVEALVDTW